MARRGGPVDRPPVHSGPIFGERFELAALAAQPLLPQAEPAIALEQALALLAHRAQAGDDADAAVHGEAPRFPAEAARPAPAHPRTQEHTSELQSLISISYAVFLLKIKK